MSCIFHNINHLQLHPLLPNSQFYFEGKLSFCGRYLQFNWKWQETNDETMTFGKFEKFSLLFCFVGDFRCGCVGVGVRVWEWECAWKAVSLKLWGFPKWPTSNHQVASILVNNRIRAQMVTVTETLIVLCVGKRTRVCLSVWDFIRELIWCRTTDIVVVVVLWHLISFWLWLVWDSLKTLTSTLWLW